MQHSLLKLKALFHTMALLPMVFLVWQVFSEQAGGDPVQYIIHFTGIGALNALVATLLISPTAKQFKLSILMKTRRLVGLYVFAYASLHIAAFLSLDLLFAWSLLASEIVKRPYILVGASAYILILMLALTSFNHIKRKMRHNWQRLHNSIYLVALLVPIHFYWSVKSEIIEPSIYIAVCLLLLMLRVKKLNIATNMIKSLKNCFIKQKDLK